MMKHEFEQLTNSSVTWEQYKIIEDVYMNYEGYNDKHEFIGRVWNARGGYNGILELYDKLHEYRSLNRRVKWLTNYNANLADDIDAMERRIAEIRKEQAENTTLAHELNTKASTMTFSIE